MDEPLRTRPAPCPFCGGEAKEIADDSYGGNAVGCQECDMWFDGYTSEGLAGPRDMWNRRSELSKPEPVLEPAWCTCRTPIGETPPDPDCPWHATKPEPGDVRERVAAYLKVLNPLLTDWSAKNETETLLALLSPSPSALRLAAKAVNDRLWDMLEGGCECDDALACQCGYNDAMKEWAALDAELRRYPEALHPEGGSK